MIRILFLITVFSLIWKKECFTQNLIQNGDFKDSLVGSFGVLYAEHWNSPSQGSPDFIHPNTREPFKAPSSYSGYQFAKSENGYYGIIAFGKNQPNAREYIQNELLRPLVKDSTYCLQFYMSLADSMNYTLKNKLGVYFSNQKLNYQTNLVLPLSPQIEFADSTYFIEKEDWVLISTEYIASGGENYLTIGHFEGDSNIDTLRIEGGDKLEHQNIYYYLDDFFLGSCDSLPEDTAIGLHEYSHFNVTIYPNPTEGTLFINDPNLQITQIQIYNSSGSIVFEDSKRAVQRQIWLDKLQSGLYFIRLIGQNSTESRKLIIK